MALADPWVHRSAGMCCATCMFYVAKGTVTEPHPNAGKELGRCRRHAPAMAGFPAVFEADWCGDHKLDATDGRAFQEDRTDGD